MSVTAETSTIGVSRVQFAPIVHIVERLAPGGIETLVLDIVSCSVAPHVIMSLQGDPESLAEQWPRLRELHVRIEAFGRSGFDPMLVGRLTRRLLQLKPRAVFAHHVGPLLYGGLAARLAGVRHLIAVEHDAWHLDNPREARLSRWCAGLLRPKIIAVSEQVAARMREVMPGRPLAVVPPGISTERFRPADQGAARQRLSLGQNVNVIGAVGRLSAVKGHSSLIEALPLMPESVHLVIVGDGPERHALEKLTATLRLTERVRFLGQRDDLELIYPAFDLLCQPSIAEGLPRTILEAQSCGVPVVATRVGGMAEAVCPHSGKLVEPNDVDALRAALSAMLARDEKRSPRDFVVGEFSLASTVRAYAELAGG
jgi:glycosyltransferase involved in cell wall biosynthesis